MQDFADFTLFIVISRGGIWLRGQIYNATLESMIRSVNYCTGTSDVLRATSHGLYAHFLLSVSSTQQHNSYGIYVLVIKLSIVVQLFRVWTRVVRFFKRTSFLIDVPHCQSSQATQISVFKIYFGHFNCCFIWFYCAYSSQQTLFHLFVDKLCNLQLTPRVSIGHNYHNTNQECCYRVHFRVSRVNPPHVEAYKSRGNHRSTKVNLQSTNTSQHVTKHSPSS